MARNTLINYPNAKGRLRSEAMNNDNYVPTLFTYHGPRKGVRSGALPTRNSCDIHAKAVNVWEAEGRVVACVCGYGEPPRGATYEPRPNQAPKRQ